MQTRWKITTFEAPTVRCISPVGLKLHVECLPNEAIHQHRLTEDTDRRFCHGVGEVAIGTPQGVDDHTIKAEVRDAGGSGEGDGVAGFVTRDLPHGPKLPGVVTVDGLDDGGCYAIDAAETDGIGELSKARG